MQTLRKIIIGSRSSKLSLIQSNIIRDLILSNNPDYKNNSGLIEIRSFTTKADRIIDQPLSEIGGKGLFTSEIENSLLDGSIDIAVHSMKDMATICHNKLSIAAISKRDDVQDVFISNKYNSLESMPQDAIVGTSSLRRRAIIMALRPDLKIVNFRGNVLTRLSKLDKGEVDAIILSYAGIKRLSLGDRINQIFSVEKFLPAPAQAVIAAQIRKNDDFINSLISKIDHKETRIEVEAERLFLRLLDGSCKTPIAALCQIDDDNIKFSGSITTLDFKKIFKLNFSSKIDEHYHIITEKALAIKEKYDNYHRG